MPSLQLAAATPKATPIPTTPPITAEQVMELSNTAFTGIGAVNDRIGTLLNVLSIGTGIALAVLVGIGAFVFWETVRAAATKAARDTAYKIASDTSETVTEPDRQSGIGVLSQSWRRALQMAKPPARVVSTYRHSREALGAVARATDHTG